jgi:non-canonical (house-cleaning) NTP pyrophosphatase
MVRDIRDFWHRFQSGVDVAVASQLPDKLLGVRDGFLRYFQERYRRAGSIRVLPHPENEARAPLPLEDAEILNLARQRTLDLERAHPDEYSFYVGSESGLLTMRSGEATRQLVRTWTVVLGLGDEAWGASGSIELPRRLIQGLDHDTFPVAIPGTRRRGGMVSSLTGGLESRRTATGLSTFLALSTLTYGLHESRPPPAGGRAGL